MEKQFIDELREKFPGHELHFSAVTIGILYQIYKYLKTHNATDAKYATYKSIWDKYIDAYNDEFGIKSYPEVYEADKESEKVRRIEKAKQIVA